MRFRKKDHHWFSCSLTGAFDEAFIPCNLLLMAQREIQRNGSFQLRANLIFIGLQSQYPEGDDQGLRPL